MCSSAWRLTASPTWAQASLAALLPMTSYGRNSPGSRDPAGRKGDKPRPKGIKRNVSHHFPHQRQHGEAPLRRPLPSARTDTGRTRRPVMSSCRKPVQRGCPHPAPRAGQLCSDPPRRARVTAVGLHSCKGDQGPGSCCLHVGYLGT